MNIKKGENTKSLQDIKKYGFRGSFIPASDFEGLGESWESDGISFLMTKGVFEVGFDDPNKEEKAKQLAQVHLDVWSFKHNRKVRVEFNYSWREKSRHLCLSDEMTVTERLITKTLSYLVLAKARIISKKTDSSSFFNNTELVEKSVKDESLRNAIRFYSEEAVGKDKPLYGIYKAVEELVKRLSDKGGGKENLGRLAGKNKKYVSDLMESTQHQRHARTKARRIITEEECRQRSKILIEAYAKTVC